MRRSLQRGYIAIALGLMTALLAACASERRATSYAEASQAPNAAVSMYAAMPYEQHPIPALDVSKIDPVYLRQVVSYPTAEQPGTIIVDTPNHFLYLVLGDGQAMRYGIGVGREGFSWAGRAYIGDRQEWPKWFPPAEMIDRQPELEPYRDGGMEPGLGNPLGARALYLYRDNKDTLYRLHGTNEPWSIGKSVSSGCIRLFNQDIIDLHARVNVGAPVLVIADPSTIAAPKPEEQEQRVAQRRPN
jgi:lipoprotein-anchoring transpeptidase ErfK/SrfK